MARLPPSAAEKAGVRGMLALLEQHADPKVAAGMARFGIATRLRVLGLKVGTIRAVAKRVGRDHAAALALWDTRLYEAQLAACFIADPAALTVATMNAWTRSFDNWATCDTACFCLFDRSPHAWGRVRAWAASRDEFVKRAAFALLASLAGHDKVSGDAAFMEVLPLIERAAADERNFVWKGVSWALRHTGVRSAVLLEACQALAERLAASVVPSCRRVGAEALKDFAKPRARALRKSATSARGIGPVRAATPRA